MITSYCIHSVTIHISHYDSVPSASSASTQHNSTRFSSFRFNVLPTTFKSCMVSESIAIKAVGCSQYLSVPGLPTSGQAGGMLKAAGKSGNSLAPTQAFPCVLDDKFSLQMSLNYFELITV